MRELGDRSHPSALDGGAVQPVERRAARVADLWARLQRRAVAADLSARAGEQLAKAQRLTVNWLAYLAFFFATVETRGTALDRAPELQQALLTQLIPALYLERVAARSTRAETRHRLRTLSAHLFEPVRHPTHPLQTLPSATRDAVTAVAVGCADRFQRRTSCVEGRNGQLSLYHQGGHRLSDRTRAALTAIHNVYIQRPDGTSAAERFFGRPHPTFFDLVLARVSRLPPPRRRRARPSKPALLTSLAA